MSVSYGGVPLGQSLSQYSITNAAGWAGAYIDPGEIEELLVKQNQGPGEEQTWPLWVRGLPSPADLGDLVWPQGAGRFAVAHYLVTSSQLKDIRCQVHGNPCSGSGACASGSGSGRHNYNPLPLIIADGRTNPSIPNRSITTLLYMLPPRPFAQIEKQNQLYLLTLVDDRYFWPTRAGIVSGPTWTALYNSIAQLLRITIVVAPISSDYGSPPEFLDGFQTTDPASLLDAIAFSVGQRIIRTLDGAVLAQDYSHAKAQQNANQIPPPPPPATPPLPVLTAWPIVAGGKFRTDPGDCDLDDRPGLVPGTIRLIYNTELGGTIDGGQAGFDANLKDLNVTGYDGDDGRVGIKALAVQGGYALISSEGAIPDNANACQGLANHWAYDWYHWQLSGIDRRYAGVVPWTPTGLDDLIRWSHREGLLATRVSRGPFNDPADRILGGTPSGGGSGSGTPQVKQTFWARLVAKDIRPGEFTAYSWERSFDSDQPPILWTDQPARGGPGNFPAYEVNNIDLTVSPDPPGPKEPGEPGQTRPTIVQLYRGAGNYYLFDMTPRWEMVQRTGPPDTITGLSPAVLLSWDQVSEVWLAQERILLVDANFDL